MTPEECERGLRKLLSGLDASGAGDSRVACYLAMALDAIGERGSPDRSTVGPETSGP